MMAMKRVNFHLTERQIGDLRQASHNTGLPMAEIVRSLIEEWRKRVKKERRKDGNPN